MRRFAYIGACGRIPEAEDLDALSRLYRGRLPALADPRDAVSWFAFVTTHASRAHARLLSDIRATGKPVPVVGEGSFVYGARRARFLVALPCLNLYKWE